MRGYLPPQNADEQLLVRRTAELAHAALADGRPRFLGFLDDRGIALAQAQLNRSAAAAEFWGGFEGAERQLLCLSETAVPHSVFPIRVLEILAPKESGLSHRDYLGALLGLGIKRELVGDLLVSGDSCRCFVQPQAAQLITDELAEVGRFGVRVQPAADAAISAPQTEEIRFTLASPRLDAALGALLHLSRTEAVRLLRSGAVAVNHVPVQDADYQIEEEDRLSVRGYGKFLIRSFGGKSRKDRIFVECEKFI